MNKYYLVYKDRCKSLIDVDLIDYNALNEYENFKDIIPEEDFKEIIRNKMARKNKRYRADSKIKELLRVQRALERESNIQTKIVFGTLSLKDDILELKENTYIRKIHAYLKKHYYYVILNKDYGSNTEREHYHFIGLTREPIVDSGHKSKKGYTLYKLEKQDYSLGHEPVIEIMNLSDSKKVRNYLLKLNNHSNKDTANKSRIRVLMNDFFKISFVLKKS